MRKPAVRAHHAILTPSYFLFLIIEATKDFGTQKSEIKAHPLSLPPLMLPANTKICS